MSTLDPVEAETLQILRMDAETIDLLVTMFPDDMAVDEHRLAASLAHLEGLSLVRRDASSEAEWWCLTAAGRDYATRDEL